MRKRRTIRQIETPADEVPAPATIMPEQKIAGVIVGSNRFLRRRDVEAETGLARSTIYKHMAMGTFPRPRRIGTRLVAWPAKEIEEWKAAQPMA